jgi:enoyl-CoA hydratase
MTDRVTYRHDQGVATITLDDGKVNVMSSAMLHDLHAALDQALQDRASVVLRSARPGIFSAGFDLKVFAANHPQQSFEMVKAGAELALRLLSHPFPTLGVMEGHAFPMGAFLLLACDVRIGARGPFRIGLNEVAIGIAPPGFAIELARSRLHPAWLNRTVTLGEMYSPDDAVLAGFLDHVVALDAIGPTLDASLATLQRLHGPSHTAAKLRLRRSAIAAVRAAIDDEITLAGYEASAARPSAVVMPGARQP